VNVIIYIQRGSVDIWKENIIESGDLSYAIVGEFLADLKQEGKTIEEFV